MIDTAERRKTERESQRKIWFFSKEYFSIYVNKKIKKEVKEETRAEKKRLSDTN